MTDQPPVLPPNQPSAHPVEGSPVTQPISAAESVPAAVPPAATKRNLWHRASSTHRGRWALAMGAGVLATVMLLGVGVAGVAFLRYHDRVGLLGRRQDGYSRGQDGADRSRRPDAADGLTARARTLCRVRRVAGPKVRVALGSSWLDRLCMVR